MSAATATGVSDQLAVSVCVHDKMRFDTEQYTHWLFCAKPRAWSVDIPTSTTLYIFINVINVAHDFDSDYVETLNIF